MPCPTRITRPPLMIPAQVAMAARKKTSVTPALADASPDSIEKSRQPKVTSLWQTRRISRQVIETNTRHATETDPRTTLGAMAAMSGEKISLKTWTNRLPKTPMATKAMVASARPCRLRRSQDMATPRHGKFWGRFRLRNSPSRLLFEGSRAMKGVVL